MSLAAGTRLGPYEIVAPLGAGGMGVVYRSRDTRLDRTVALKVLAPHLAANDELRARFEREARAISALNHPNICTLHDVGHQDGVHFLVMEHLEGQTLADRLARGPLPAEHVLRHGMEIAGALDKAHRQGIVHRDLKPGNVMLTKAGAKLLDFGLATLRPPAGVTAPAASVLQTPDKPLTAEGSIVGTLQYMAPEQLEGREADARTDIFALGSLLYEMAAGRRAFSGRTQASLIGAILRDDPTPLATLQPLAPPGLGRVVHACLAKDPDDRWQSAHDVRLQLDAISGGTDHAGAKPEDRPVARLRERLAWAAVGAAVVAGLAGGFAALRTSRSGAGPRPLVRFVITLPVEQAPDPRFGCTLAISPDGQRVAYLAGRDAQRQLYIRTMDQLAATPVPGTQWAENPFFSLDGEWLGFFAGDKLKKVSIHGGAPITLTDAENGRGGAWAPDGTIVFAPATNSGLVRVSSTGGKPQPLTRLDEGSRDRSHRWPDVLPDGKTVLFTAAAIGTATWEEARIEIASSTTGERRVLLEGGSHARYVASGHIVFCRSGTLLAVPFDVRRLRVTGTPTPVLDGVVTSFLNGAAQMAVSRSGSLVHIQGPEWRAERELVWVDRKGVAQPLGDARGAFVRQRLSPDGSRVAMESFGPAGGDVWVYDISRRTLARLTFERWPGAPSAVGRDLLTMSPAWSPDGSRIAFTAGSVGGTGSVLFWKPADGSAAEEPLMKADDHLQQMGSWSPDGRLLTFMRYQPPNGWDVWVLPLAGDRQPRPLVAGPEDEVWPMLSPDGRWLAYVSNESARDEVYVRPFPGLGGKWQISSDGGRFPAWARNGRELFYRNGDRMMAVDLTLQPKFSAGPPRLLFEARYAPVSFDVAPDGRRFLMLKDVVPPALPTQIDVVLNWADELGRRVRPGDGR